MNINEITAGPPMFVPAFNKTLKDASEACAVMKHYGLLYRGLGRDQPGITSYVHTDTTPVNRIPTCTSFRPNPYSNTGFQIEFDAHLKKLGFKALRSNSIFCSGNLAEAATYGKLFAIFPHNGFDFTWSPEIEDAYNAWEKFETGYDRLHSPPPIAGGRGEWHKILHNMTQNDFKMIFKFRQTDLGEAIKSKNEIYIHGTYTQYDLDIYGDLIKRALGIV